MNLKGIFQKNKKPVKNDQPHHGENSIVTMGIDIGSITTKAVMLSDNEITASGIIFTGYNAEEAGTSLYNDLIRDSGIDPASVKAVVSTGYGRKSISFATRSITEITCHAAGAHFVNPAIRGVIDIGGQDSKAISIDADGIVLDFVMNDKCAAGTGRFLEVMARALGADLENFGQISLSSRKPAVISSTCTVFAESEVISLISKGENRENIIAGIHQSVAKRITSMTKRIKLSEPVMMTGGVAKNIGVIRALESNLGVKIIVNNDTAQINGAIGAAVLAARS